MIYSVARKTNHKLPAIIMVQSCGADRKMAEMTFAGMANNQISIAL